MLPSMKDYTIEEIDEQIKPVIQDVIGDAEIQAQKVAGGNEIIFKTRVLTVDERETDRMHSMRRSECAGDTETEAAERREEHQL